MVEKLTTQTAFRYGDIVMIEVHGDSAPFVDAEYEPETHFLARVVYADTVGIAVTASGHLCWNDYLDACEGDIPTALSTAIEGCYFFPWRAVNYLKILMTNATYSAWLVSQAVSA